MTVPPQATGRARLPVGAVVINKSAAWRSVGGFSRGTKVIELSESEKGGEVLKGRTTTSCTPVKVKIIALGGRWGVVIVILFCILSVKCCTKHGIYYACTYSASSATALQFYPPSPHVACGRYLPPLTKRQAWSRLLYFKVLLCFLWLLEEKMSLFLP